ncbi:M12 family metallopeptidase [Ruegeria sp. R14_0]|uniref:M12 family metallopeptidase n=1 Tax=Ruegeria sp. R14_0 TaxID=2821100 RepID=UPI001ADC4B56|nr:M12 family metallopeptidase [Ruegeria sp. R14_0]MBO9448551.1 hypothetical protein [Ruegeria sp. R14_0]
MNCNYLFSFVAAVLFALQLPNIAFSQQNKVNEPEGYSDGIGFEDVNMIRESVPLENGDTLEFWVTEDGLAVVGGDIVLGTVEEVMEQVNSGVELESFGIVVRDDKQLWPKGVIPFAFAENFTDKKMIRYVNKAAKEWTKKTDITFEKMDLGDLPDEALIIKRSAGCKSHLGFKEGKERNLFLSDLCTYNHVVHELAHIIGLFHEHARSDRDKYIKINNKNLKEGVADQFEFDKQQHMDLLDYCFESTTHYWKNAFAKETHLTTIESRNPAYGTVPLKPQGIAECDVKVVNELYSEEVK